MPDDHADLPFDPDEQHNERIGVLRDQLAEHLAMLGNHATAAQSVLRQLRADDVFDIEFVEGPDAAAFAYHLQTVQHTIAAARALNPDNNT